MSAAAWLAAFSAAGTALLALGPRRRPPHLAARPHEVAARAGHRGGTSDRPPAVPSSAPPRRVGRRGPSVRSPWGAGLGAGSLLLAGLVVGGVLAGVGLAVGGLAGRAAMVRAARRRQERVVASAVPELIDLFVVAASAGQPVSSCLRAVAGRAPPPIRPAVAAAHDRVGRGEPVAVALAALAEALGPLAEPLTDALVDSHRTGAPLVGSLARAAEAARDVRRRRAEERVRRLPVTLLFPLVCCVLPAFGLLAVIPLLAASLPALSG